MIGTRFPIEIPPGMVSNGTETERAGRWIDGLGVRFLGREGIPVPIGADVPLTIGGPAIAGTPRFMYAYQDQNGGATRVIVATTSTIYTFLWPVTGQSKRDTLPVGFSSFFVDTFSAANFGSTLLVTAAGYAASPLWFQTAFTDALNKSNNFFTQYGDDARGVLVTPEEFVVVIVGNTDVAWASQGGFTIWAPASTNSAGALTVPTTGRLFTGHVVNGETLLWSDKDLWQLEYVGGDLVYGLRQRGEACGVIGANCAVPLSNSVIWMSQQGFFQYDGYVRELPCDLADYVFGDMNTAFGVPHKFFARRKKQYNEVWFHYCSAGSASPNRVVIYNYENQTWSKGPSLPTVTAGTHDDIIAASDSANVPTALDAAGSSVLVSDYRLSVAPGAFLQSGDLPLPNDRTLQLQKFIPDDPDANDTFSLTARYTEGGAAVTTAIQPNAVRPEVDVRIGGRYFRYKQTFGNTASRVGKPQLAFVPSSPR